MTAGGWPAHRTANRTAGWPQRTGPGFRSVSPGAWGGALIRGGKWVGGTAAGVFAVDASHSPSHSNNRVGFRCAR
jgi:hypothetical protein